MFFKNHRGKPRSRAVVSASMGRSAKRSFLLIPASPLLEICKQSGQTCCKGRKLEAVGLWKEDRRRFKG